ncbi:MAG: exodeoxyribonuclease VII large subunit, partial [Defluviitaleaceae bacterium]|nr:exodeoxyribonuclease VII large subunit [Defluviitaleaceae bacterium]
KSLNGHLHFVIKDNNAKLDAVMFHSDAIKLDFKPEDGMKILLYGRMGYFDKNGVTQIIARKMDFLGIGDLFEDFFKLKIRLQSEGIFSNCRPIPTFPKTVCIVTSPKGAAIYDIISVIKRRNPALKILISPALVQGDSAPEDIAVALYLANKVNPDVIICARGGGSFENLAAFNTEIVARAVYASRVPVISAIGHETDYTLCDFAADMRVQTPTAAAVMVSADIGKVWENTMKRLLKAGDILLKDMYFTRKDLKSNIAKTAKNMDMLLEKQYDAILEKTRALKKLSLESALKRGYAVVKMRGHGRLISHGEELKGGEKIELIFGDKTIYATVDDKWEIKTENQ